ERITVAAAGDLFVPPRLTAQAAADAADAGREGHDFTAILASIAPVVAAADLAVCHLEQPLAEPAGPFPDYPYFAAPPQLADAIAEAGFDTCSTASNHALDSGMEGIVRTLDHLDRVEVAHTDRGGRAGGGRGSPVVHLQLQRASAAGGPAVGGEHDRRGGDPGGGPAGAGGRGRDRGALAALGHRVPGGGRLGPGGVG